MVVLLTTLINIFSWQTFASDSIRISAAYLPENAEQYRGGETSGRDFEIVREILKCAKLKASFDIQPYMRHVLSYKNEAHIDGVITVPMTMSPPGFGTKNYINYHNGVIVRDKDFPQGISTIEDLKGKHVITFVGAEQLLIGLKGKTKTFASYIEDTAQVNHNEILIKRRADVVFSDGLIFMAHHKRLLERKPEYKNIKVKFYRIFKTNPFKAFFKRKDYQEKFDRCLDALSESGNLDKIEVKYVDKYDEYLGEEYLKPLLRKEK